VRNILIGLALVASLGNVVRFAYLYYHVGGGSAAIWWNRLDWLLLWWTAALFILIYIYHEIDVRCVLERASKSNPVS
jgi:hypothetical protein